MKIITIQLRSQNNHYNCHKIVDHGKSEKSNRPVLPFNKFQRSGGARSSSNGQSTEGNNSFQEFFHTKERTKRIGSISEIKAPNSCSEESHRKPSEVLVGDVTLSLTLPVVNFVGLTPTYQPWKGSKKSRIADIKVTYILLLQL